MDCIPAQPWMFIDFLQLGVPKSFVGGDKTEDQLADIRKNILGFDEPGMYCMATSFVEKPVPVSMTALLSSGRWWNQFMLLSTDTFEEPVMVVKNIGAKDTDKDALFVIDRREKWSSHFLS